MRIQEFQLFIEQTLYDLQTVKFLLKYDRIAETKPIVRQIWARIRAFRWQLNQQTDEFKNIFQDELWGLDLSEKLETESEEYLRFIGQIRLLSLGNISKLRKLVKLPGQRKRQAVLIIFSAAGLAALFASIMFVRFFLHDCGIKGDFYRGENFGQYIATGETKIIDFNYYLEMNTKLPREHFSARWQGFLIAPKEGTYTFYLLLDDGARMFIDDRLLIDAWRSNDSQEYKGEIFLSKGRHRIRVDYYNAFGESVLKLFWAFEGGRKEIVPAWYFRKKG